MQELTHDEAFEATKNNHALIVHDVFMSEELRGYTQFDLHTDLVDYLKDQGKIDVIDVLQHFRGKYSPPDILSLSYFFVDDGQALMWNAGRNWYIDYDFYRD